MALAQALIAQSRQSMARQSYVRIVCAWCQQMIRWHRAEEMIRGQISHSICFDCFAHVFWELEPDNTPPPICTQVTAGDHSSHGLGFPIVLAKFWWLRSVEGHCHREDA
jgi:hypothetical protein